MADVFKIAEILVSHALEAHPGEIAIVAYYGSHAKGLASPTSDLDLFYIPDAGQAQSLCSQFILDGLPYDFWPVSWELAEDIANARSHRPWAVSASMIADARVLYHRSSADLDRFEALKTRIVELTRPENRRLMVERALDAFRDVLVQQGQMRLAMDAHDAPGLGWAGWKLVNSAINCLALVNQTYLSRGWGASVSQVSQWPARPDDVENLVRAITHSGDMELALGAADALTRAVRQILLAAQASVAEPCAAQQAFKDFYVVIHEYKAKVLAACERRNTPAASYAAFQLQDEICGLMKQVERGLAGTDFFLLGEYSGAYEQAGFPDLTEAAFRGDLEALARQVQQLDAKAQEWFNRHSIDLGLLESEQALRRFLARRDPAQRLTGPTPGA